MRKRHKLEMSINHRGDLQVVHGGTKSVPSEFELHVSQGDHVEFYCIHGKFGIHFPENSPFEQKEYRAGAGEPIAAIIRTDAEPGRYKHNVSVELGNGPRYWDPDIVVDE